MEDADVLQKGHNATCGDDLVFYLKWNKNKGVSADKDTLADISFGGLGCAISQSGASMLTDEVKGMTRAEMMALDGQFMYKLYGTEISPQREKCAMLGLWTLHEALKAPSKKY